MHPYYPSPTSSDHPRLKEQQSREQAIMSSISEVMEDEVVMKNEVNCRAAFVRNVKDVDPLSILKLIIGMHTFLPRFQFSQRLLEAIANFVTFTDNQIPKVMELAAKSPEEAHQSFMELILGFYVGYSRAMVRELRKYADEVKKVHPAQAAWLTEVLAKRKRTMAGLRQRYEWVDKWARDPASCTVKGLERLGEEALKRLHEEQEI